MTVIGEPLPDIDSVEFFKRPEDAFILGINLFKGIPNYFHSFGCHLSKGWTAWPGWQAKSFHHGLDP
jgi:hypothetical protein